MWEPMKEGLSQKGALREQGLKQPPAHTPNFTHSTVRALLSQFNNELYNFSLFLPNFSTILFVNHHV